MSENDLSVFAILTAKDTRNRANTALSLAHNARWFQPATGGVANQATIESREPTPSPEDDSKDDGTPMRLVLTFPKLMELEDLREGIQVGSQTATSHVLLGHRGTPGISSRQYSIVVNDKMQIFLNDRSKHGTAVAYNDVNADQYRKHETWILAYEPGARDPFGPITIHTGGVTIGIEFPNHNGSDERYIESLRALIKRTKGNAVPGIQGLDITSPPETEPPSRAQIATGSLIYFKDQEIGTGTFSKVYTLIRARDGKVFAGKVALPPTNVRKRRRGEIDPEWLRRIRNEYTIIKDHPHPNIVQVIELRERPEVMIVMPYFPCGDMAHAGILAESELVTAVGQIIDCLAFLHSHDIAHRDIKPENVLFEEEPYFKVVLTDFGLSKAITETTFLKTFCGTYKYCAPELFQPGNTYNTSADVWSLGVMALEWLYDLPQAPPLPKARNLPEKWRTWNATWVDSLVTWLVDQGSGTSLEMLQGMLNVNPEPRYTAKACLKMGMEKDLFQRRLDDGLVCAVDSAPNTPGHEAEGHEAKGQEKSDTKKRGTNS
ncbi:kinase-like protein [Pseudovirgaria hyperparasitica]|uniref:Kinase-like protein n=1 Tax=Pseudovirgaria hyperparasitica TaxID=470096 RepID=A0A6A6WAR4_9PEZI|nr:kinase-like protein [Pseudovirgaria hyperparasitica]KAF2759763.1 kinase-like protein [Pseudovirgaria hyperparasitica]